jgi:hypothetical protein
MTRRPGGTMDESDNEAAELASEIILRIEVLIEEFDYSRSDIDNIVNDAFSNH